MKRRDFLKTSVAGAAAISAAAAPSWLLSSCDSKTGKGTELKLALQEWLAIGDSLDEKLDYLESLGFAGIEFGGSGLATRTSEIKDAMRRHSIKPAAICAGFEGFILAEDPMERAVFNLTMHEIIRAAGEIGSTGVIMVPAFNNQTPCKPHTMETREFLTEELAKLGEFALECGTTVILEPLNRGEAFYLRQVPDAAAICRDSNCDGVKCMGDFWHMQEETSDYAAFMAAGTGYLQHVHIASRATRNVPGEDGDADNYVEGFRALKEMGYDKYVSFECGCKGNLADALPAAAQLLREQWGKA